MAKKTKETLYNVSIQGTATELVKVMECLSMRTPELETDEILYSGTRYSCHYARAHFDKEQKREYTKRVLTGKGLSGGPYRSHDKQVMSELISENKDLLFLFADEFMISYNGLTINKFAENNIMSIVGIDWKHVHGFREYTRFSDIQGQECWEGIKSWCVKMLKEGSDTKEIMAAAYDKIIELIGIFIVHS